MLFPITSTDSTAKPFTDTSADPRIDASADAAAEPSTNIPADLSPVSAAQHSAHHGSMYGRVLLVNRPRPMRALFRRNSPGKPRRHKLCSVRPGELPSFDGAGHLFTLRSRHLLRHPGPHRPHRAVPRRHLRRGRRRNRVLALRRGHLQRFGWRGGCN